MAHIVVLGAGIGGVPLAFEADFGDDGIAFVAQPQIPPRNVTWSSQGYWVHMSKVAFERYFLRKIRQGSSEPGYERYVMKRLGIEKLRRGERPPLSAMRSGDALEDSSFPSMVKPLESAGV